MSILTQELSSPGLISILGELKELLMECDIWAWIIYGNEFSSRSDLLAFCLVFDFSPFLWLPPMHATVSVSSENCFSNYTAVGTEEY